MNIRLDSVLLPYVPAGVAARRRRPPRGARALLFGVCATVALFIFWAAFTQVEELVRGTGQVIPSQRVQHIQNLEGGIVREILVVEGQAVERGQVLLRIDNEQAGSLFRDTLARSLDLEAAMARLEAEIEHRDPVFSASLRAQGSEAVARHLRLLQTHRDQDAAEIKALESQIKVRTLEHEEQNTRVQGLGESLALVERQRNVARKLLSERSFSEMEYLALEERVTALRGEIASLRAAMQRTQASIAEVEEKLALHRTQRLNEDMEELTRVSAELAALRETLVAGEDRVIRTEVRSPVKGVVKSVLISTEGGVIMPGALIMEVVPLEDALIIEARIKPQDIAFLYVGQPARIRLTAYDFATYGALDGVVETIGADTVEGRNGEIFYLVKLRTDKTALEHNGQELPVMPGMQATADIISGHKTVLSYLTKPIIRAARTALREP